MFMSCSSNGYPWAKIIQGWKSFTGRWALKQNARLGLGIPKPNQFWIREYWDRFIRNEKHYRNVVEYIEMNPVKARLCGSPEEWTFSSAHPSNEEDLRAEDEDEGDSTT